VVVTSLLDVLNFGEAFTHMIYYIVHCYTVFFGLVTILNELEHEFAPHVSQTLYDVKTWMRQWAKGLTTLWGRGLFYFFQGTMALAGSTSGKLGEIVGVYMIFMGIACFRVHFRNPDTDPVHGAYVQIV